LAIFEVDGSIYGSIIESLFETPAGSKACVSGANLGAEKPSTEISWKTNGQGGHFILSFDLGYFIFA